jgi:hypothetical protein
MDSNTLVTDIKYSMSNKDITMPNMTGGNLSDTDLLNKKLTVLNRLLLDDELSSDDSDIGDLIGGFLSDITSDTESSTSSVNLSKSNNTSLFLPINYTDTATDGFSAMINSSNNDTDFTSSMLNMLGAGNSSFYKSSSESASSMSASSMSVSQSVSSMSSATSSLPKYRIISDKDS